MKASASGPREHTFLVLSDRDAVAHYAAAYVSELLLHHDPFMVALAGGSTPRRLYEILAEPPGRDRIPWSQIHWFWGDERCVPPGHSDSNYQLARESLLSRVPVPAAHIHRIRCEQDPAQAAADYESELDRCLGAERQFDLILLGMGEDGHTASLFPGTTALAESERSVAAVYVPRLDAWRVTLTLPVLNAARHVLFIVTGSDKAPALARIRAGEPLPAGLVRPRAGELTWLVDRAAAGAQVE